MVSVNCCSKSSLGEGLKPFSWQKLSLPEENIFEKNMYITGINPTRKQLAK